MKYNEDVITSAEYMRTAIPLMAQHSAGFSPISYSVWYEFVAGINNGLKKAIIDITSKGDVLDANTTNSLFQKYISELDPQIVQQISMSFQNVLKNTAQATSEVKEKASQFDQTLEQWHGELGSLNLPNVGQILGNSRDMQSAIVILQERLAKSQNEIEALRQEVSRSRNEALTDGLTQLSNRRGFDIALARYLHDANQERHSLCLLMIDIDHFKAINDTYGHLFGDKVISAIAQVIRQNIKGKDTAARYGGEEFAVLLPDTPLNGALLLANNIRTYIEKSRIKRNQDNIVVSNITISLGVASYCKGETAAEFIIRADQALYQSKHNGRNRVTAEVSVK